MPRRCCRRHGPGEPCTCAMGNLYRFVEPVVLYLLKKKGKTYGYELGKALGEHSLTDSIIEPGALYRTLRRLEENGYVISKWDVSGAGPAKRLYELTPDGEKHLNEWVTVLDQLANSMSGFVSDARSLLEQISVADSA
ncbi:PadR family transcriptional regulator [bacterium]|nr:PadR family transcriptional regulator [bacterium]